MPSERFDDALWLASLDAAGSLAWATLSASFRAYFATRSVEWEVGSGGFSGAVECARAHWSGAIEGYRLLGDDASAALLERIRDGLEPDLDAVDERVGGPPWNGVPWSDGKRVDFVRAHRDDFTSIEY